MQYIALTQEDRDQIIVEELWSRERAYFLHEMNVERLAAQLSKLPDGDWPVDIEYLRGKGRDDIYRTAQSGKHAELAQLYAERDWLRHLHKTESLERDREDRYHAEVLKRAPAGERLTTAIAATRQKREAAELWQA